MQSPVASLSGPVWRAGDFDKTVVEREAMADRVLPALLVLPIKWEKVHNKLINLTKSAHFVLRLLYRHRDKRNIRVWRLGVCVRPSVVLISPWSVQGAVSVHRHDVRI